LIFVAGLVLGWHRNELGRLGALARAPLCQAVTYALAIGFIWFAGQTHLFDPFTAETGATVTDIFAKWNLPPLRLLAGAVFFLGAFHLVDRLWRPIHRVAGEFLLRLGTTALPAYIAHLPIVAIDGSYRARFLPMVPTAAQNVALQVAALGVVMLVVIAWDALPTLGHRLRRVRTNPRLIPNVIGVVVLTAFVGVVGAQPFLVQSDVRFIGVPDDRGHIDRPRYQLYVPRAALARQPLTLVLVVAEPGLESDLIARDLIAAADNYGWILVAAPHVEFIMDLSAVDAVRRDFPGQYRGIADIVATIPGTTGLRVHPDVSIIGMGRAAALAQRYALVQAADVRAVALLSGSQYTVPPMAQVIAPPAFPVGTAEMERLTERPIDEAEVRRTRYWIGVGTEDVAPLPASPEWDQQLGTNRLERAVRLTTILREGGANVELALFPGVGSEVATQARASAIQFLRFASATGPDLPPYRMLRSQSVERGELRRQTQTRGRSTGQALGAAARKVGVRQQRLQVLERAPHRAPDRGRAADRRAIRERHGTAAERREVRVERAARDRAARPVQRRALGQIQVLQIEECWSGPREFPVEDAHPATLEEPVADVIVAVEQALPGAVEKRYPHAIAPISDLPREKNVLTGQFPGLGGLARAIDGRDQLVQSALPLPKRAHER